ncbi:MAG TPA: hypothetical protein VF898_13175 [Chloroflexota bacterium]
MDDWLQPRREPKSESRRLLGLLIAGSLVVAVVIVWAVTSVLSGPLILGIMIAAFFLCLDALAIAIVWYSMQRR